MVTENLIKCNDQPTPPTSAMRRLLARHLQGLLLLLVQGGKISGRTAHASPHVHAKSVISAWLSLVLEKVKCTRSIDSGNAFLDP